MFDLLDRPLVWIPVKFAGLKQEDDEEVARAVEHRVELQVEIVDRDEFRALFGLDRPVDRYGNRPDMDGAEEKALVERLVKSWRKVVNGKTPVPFSPENLAKLLAVPNFATGFGAAYVDAYEGRAEVREGNSESSPSNGQAGAASSGTPTAETSKS